VIFGNTTVHYSGASAQELNLLPEHLRLLFARYRQVGELQTMNHKGHEERDENDCLKSASHH